MTHAVPESASRLMELELAVEARRLGFQACRSAASGAAVDVQVHWASGLVRLAVRAGARLIERDVALRAETDDDLLELAVILGDTVREAISSTYRPSPEPPPAQHWRVGGRGGLAAFPVPSTLLYGGALNVRTEWTHLALEVALGGQASRAVVVPQGAVTLAGGTLEVAALARLVGSEVVQLHLEGGGQAAAISISATPGEGIQATPRWAGTIDLRLGVVIEVPFKAFRISLRGGGLISLLGMSARADGLQAIGVSGPGLYSTLGVSIGSGRCP